MSSKVCKADLKVGDEVDCKFEDVWYEAKIKRIDKKKGYFVHYYGWNPRYDHWTLRKNLRLPEEREVADNDSDSKERYGGKGLKRKHSDESALQSSSSLKRTRSGRCLDKEKAEEGNEEKKSKKRCRKPPAKNSDNDDDDDDDVEAEKKIGSTSSSKKKTKNISSTCTKVKKEEMKRKAIKLNLPRELKSQLVLDWEQITLEPRKLVPLPRSPSIHQIFEQFITSRGGNRDTQKKWREFIDALSLYFNKAISKLLLYRFEKIQFSKLDQAEQHNPITCFGAEHLLRLFAKLPEFLAITDLSPSEISITKSRLSDLFKYLVANRDAFFLSHYQLSESILGKALGKRASSSYS